MTAPRSALVTGASRGIGHGIALRLAQLGYGLSVTARDADRLAAVREELLAAGAPAVVTYAADAASDEAAAVVDMHVDSFGTMDALVLAAGVGTAGPLAGYPLHRLDKQWAVNLRTPFAIVSRALPALRAAPAGARVIALSSIGGVHAEPGLGAYGAVKAALVSLCRSLNVEESGNGVSATAVCPAYVDTDMSAWVHDQVPADAMITVADVVTLAESLLSLSPNAVVTELVVSRAGTSGYIA